MDGNFSLRAHTGGFRAQLNPGTPAVVTETGGMELAAFEQIPMIAAFRIAPVADELVQKLSAFIVAEIDDHLSVGGKGDRRILVLEAAKRCPFPGRGSGIDRIDLDNVAEAVGLVRMPGNVKTLIGSGPAIAEIPCLDAIAFHVRQYLVVGAAA